MMHAKKTKSSPKWLKTAAVCALFAIIAFPLVCSAALFPFGKKSQSSEEKCNGFTMDVPPVGCFYPCANPYKLKNGTQCCADTKWRAMPPEYTRPEKNDACYDTDAVLAADGEYCYKQTPADTNCPDGFAWNDFNASYDKAQSYCACVAVRCPEGSNTEKKRGCYTYRDTGQKSGNNTCWISLPLDDKCPQNETKNPAKCAFGYTEGEKTECGTQCYKCKEPDDNCPSGQSKNIEDCWYGYTHGGRTQAGSQCYNCKDPTCAFFALIDDCHDGCTDGIKTTCVAKTPQGTPLQCFEKITETCPQGCDGKNCASKKCEDFGYVDNCETGCVNSIRITCEARDPGYGLRCFERIEEPCAHGCDGNSCNIRTCESGGYVKSCTDGCADNYNTTCKPVDYYGMLCYEKQTEHCAQGCSPDGTACNRKSCADGGYTDSCGEGCVGNVMTKCTPQSYYGLSCFEKQTEKCTQGCTFDGLDCNRKNCEDGGYFDTCQQKCAGNIKTTCKRVDYYGKVCYEKQEETCTQGCADDGLTCNIKACADGGYVESCKKGCRNNVDTDCKEVEYYGLTCYEKKTQNCKQGCAPDNASCNIKICADGGYVERCVAGCAGSAKTTCTEVKYYGLTCYDRQVENCAQSCAPDGQTCNDKTCSDFSDSTGVKLTDSCTAGCADNTLISCKQANPGYGLTCYSRTAVQCQNGCAETDECNLCPAGFSTEKTGQCYDMAVGADNKTICYKETPCCASGDRTFALEKPSPVTGYDIVEAQGLQGGYCYKAKPCPEPEETSCDNTKSETECTICHDTEHYSGATQCRRIAKVSNRCPSGQTHNVSECANGYVLGNKTECGEQCYICNLCPAGFVTRTGAQCYYKEIGADNKTMCYQNVECCADKSRAFSMSRPYREQGYDIVAAQGSQGGYCYKGKGCPEPESLNCEPDIIETQCVVCHKTENYSGMKQCQKKIIKSNVCKDGQTKETQNCKYGYELGDKTECGEQCYTCKVCPSGYSTGSKGNCYEVEIGADGVTKCYKDVNCCANENRAFSATKPTPEENFEISAARGAQGGYCYQVKK
ncbi:MAG: hypothetical protein IKR92_00985 [Alphaproteobacteria bacterium]|nr:hypothetical protein [Alphaproteobacteria bacterium]